jgi:hypothetical protein
MIDEKYHQEIIGHSLCLPSCTSAMLSTIVCVDRCRVQMHCKMVGRQELHKHNAAWIGGGGVVLLKFSC